MFSYNQKISMVQLNMLLLFYFLNTTLLFLPSSLARINSNSIIFITLFWTIFAILLGTFLTFFGRKIPSYTAVEWYQMSFGKLGNVFAFALGFALLFFGALEIRVFAEIVLAYMLPKTPVWLVLAMLVFLATFSSGGGLEANGRLAEILAFFVIIPLVVVIVGVALSVDFHRVLPMSIPDFQQLIQGGNDYSPIFQGLLLLLFVFPLINESSLKNSFSVVGSIVFYGGFVVFMVILCIAVYGGELLGEKLFPTLQMMERISFQGIFMTRQDALVLWFWFASSLIFTSGMIFFANLVQKKIMKKDKNYYKILGGILYVIGILPKDLSAVYELRRTVIPWLNLIFLLILPIIMIAIYYWKRNNNSIKLGIVLILPVFLTGCWDSQNPENRGYIITMGIDVHESNGESDGESNGENAYNFSFAPAKTQTNEPELLTSTGNTIARGVVGVDSKNSRKTDLGQLKIIVVGEEVFSNENSFLPLLDELERTQEISEKVMILCADGKAESVLQALMKEEQGLFLWNFYQNTGRNVAITKGLDLDTFLAEYWEQKGSVIIPKIQTIDEKVSIGGGVVLKNGAYNYTMNKEEEEGYLFLTGHGKGAVIEGESESGEFFIPMEVISQKIQYEFSKKYGNYYCVIKTDFVGDLLSSYENEAFGIEEKNKVEELLKSKIQQEMEKTLSVATENNDFEALGISSKLRRKFPEIEENFLSEIENKLNITFDINVKLRDTGKIR